MRSEEHANSTRELFGEGYEEIHKYLDRNFDWMVYERLSSLTDGDYYPGESVDLFAHRKDEHHREGIELIVEHFKEKYSAEIVRKVAERHIRDDYQGHLPEKKDFDNPEFLKKYHN